MWRILLLSVVVLACVDTGAITEANDFIGEQLSDKQVVALNCSVADPERRLAEGDTIAVAQKVECDGVNAAGSILAVDGVSLLIWSVTDTLILRTDVAGEVTGIRPGAAAVVARGPRNSQAAFLLTVR